MPVAVSHSQAPVLERLRHTCAETTVVADEGTVLGAGSGGAAAGGSADATGSGSRTGSDGAGGADTGAAGETAGSDCETAAAGSGDGRAANHRAATIISRTAARLKTPMMIRDDDPTDSGTGKLARTGATETGRDGVRTAGGGGAGSARLGGLGGGDDAGGGGATAGGDGGETEITAARSVAKSLAVQNSSRFWRLVTTNGSFDGRAAFAISHARR